MSAREELRALKAALKAKLKARKRQFRIDAWHRARLSQSLNRYHC